MNTSDKYKAALNFVNESKYEELITYLKSRDSNIFFLDGSEIIDKETFLQKTGASAQASVPTNWAQLADLIGDIILQENKNESAIVWTHADKMLESGLRDLITISDIFYRTARNCADNGKRFRAFLLGRGDNFAD